MTAPVSMAPVAVPPVAAGQAATPAAPDDVFASVLAALSGALGLPVPVPGQPQLPEGSPAEHGIAASAAGTALPAVASATAEQHAATATGTADAAPSPAAWTAVTQRPVLAGAAQDAPAVAPTAPHEAAAHEHPAHPTAVADLPAAAPTAEEAHRPEAAAPAVPAEQAAPAVDAAAVPPTPVVHAAPPAAAHAESPVAATTSTHHVKPALVEAARGLRHEGGGRTSLVVRLDPPELGAVLVRLTVQDGRVDVTLRTPDLAARADLQAQSYDVEQVLRDQGFDLSSFDVGHGDVLPDGRQDAPDRGTPDRNGRADGHTAHSPVTDDGPAPEPSGTWL